MRHRDRESSLVYSTDPVRGRAAGVPVTAQAQREPGVVRIWLEKKGRAGKPVSIVRGLALDRGALDVLAGRLKRSCSSGGSVKDGEIIIQGDHRWHIAALLEGEGLRVKLAGG